MAASVITHDPEMVLPERYHTVPSGQITGQRMAEHQDGCVFAPFNFDIELCAVYINKHLHLSR